MPCLWCWHNQDKITFKICLHTALFLFTFVRTVVETQCGFLFFVIKCFIEFVCLLMKETAEYWGLWYEVCSVLLLSVPLCLCALQNRPSVITCASANNRNCNLSHCPIAHSACSGAAYRRPSSCKCHPKLPSASTAQCPCCAQTDRGEAMDTLGILRAAAGLGGERCSSLFWKASLKKNKKKKSTPHRQISHYVYFSAADKQQPGPADPPTLLF